MAEIINLNKYRKARKRAAESVEATQNRIRHGRTKAERDRAQEDTARAGRKLDDRRLDDPDDGQEPA